VPQPVELCDATSITDCEPVKDFDVKKLYKDNREIDQDHPSRIDFYGQLFQNFPEGTDTMMQKVFKLKKKLRLLAGMQAKFEKKLDHPVKTAMTVMSGEPGRMGERGPRGEAGPPGFMGNTGPRGRVGHTGRPGLPGDEGFRGRDGPIGLTGDRGRLGVDGDRGAQGMRGAPGVRGARGPVGPRGYAGENGPQGLEGQTGNGGARGTSPAGPLGSTGVSGAQGVEGPKGGSGKRGASGAFGYPGSRGDPGQSGYIGKAGRNAKRLPAAKCGMTDTMKKNVCCGIAAIDWRSFGNNAYIDVNTRSCKFSDNDVMYFTEIFGSGGQWTSLGAQALYSSSKTGFRVYVTQMNGGSARSWWMNALRQQIKWCGIGVATGPKQQGVCCGVGKSSDLRRNGGYNMYTDI